MRSEVRVPGQQFSLLHIFQTGSGATQIPIQWIVGVLSSGVKSQGLEGDLSPPTSAGGKKTWHYVSAPPYVFMA
jgi:hypothetical protein